LRMLDLVSGIEDIITVVKPIVKDSKDTGQVHIDN
jgi:hypothetical protein